MCVIIGVIDVTEDIVQRWYIFGNRAVKKYRLSFPYTAERHTTGQSNFANRDIYAITLPTWYSCKSYFR